MENLKEILATPKQIGLLLGAGVSKACGLPNIEDITKKVKATSSFVIATTDQRDSTKFSVYDGDTGR